MALEVEVVPFAGHLSRADFDCGNKDLNEWLRTKARQHQERGISRTFLAILKTGTLDAWQEVGFKDVVDTTVLGYFTLSSAQVMNAELPPAGSKLPRNVPVVRLGRLAVHQQLKGRGFGTMLLMEAITRAAQVSDAIGVTGLFVDAKDEAAPFYEKFGFQRAELDPLKLWLPLASITELLKA
ncbi:MULTISPECIES: GNAT family N-acetyltransferase [Xanthomonas]|uniref:GNAT family N-acetyltransferase n=1 Tax=Xanthomonas cucurbitae TaxID=56453 RepID=A0ABY7YC54_9XANT|nr:GNAT family N-acetyltransferase [Xanthomonas cucurbitae]QHG85689.1 GNAT family N-acetyltransferase [Xanthomonas cucurbitae]WDM67582.1 GNAT family N-acetyltransferase [Xanthomonas cucurbitae]WDM71458.1 GNAT family N-acetyltransferase [Xanthomonas cucurbitae]WDM75565.1 GNAT family N-acetyltransferase [Xanthomonas cucurbitae]